MSVEIDKNGDIWTIINDRSDARNAVDTDHAKALVSAFDAFENGPGRGSRCSRAGALSLSSTRCSPIATRRTGWRGMRAAT